MCGYDSIRDSRGHESLSHSIQAFEMPKLRLSLRRLQILEGTRVAQREQETAPNELSKRLDARSRQVSIFRHFVRRFLPLQRIGSNILSKITTLCRGELRRGIGERFDTRFDI